MPKILTDEIGDHNPGYVVCEVEMLLGTDSPDRIAQRLGYANSKVLGRQLRRWRRHDLAIKFEGTPPLTTSQLAGRRAG